MSFLDECEHHFGSKDLYIALGLAKNASDKVIKLAYRKMSLKVHPDRVSEEEKQTATEKFQILGKIFSILSDVEKRKIYDESGCIDDECNYIFDWAQFWSSKFGNLEDVIKEYTDSYWGSKSEEQDLKKAYNNFKGDMNKIMKSMYCRVVEHEPRYRELIQGWIEIKEVLDYKAFSQETKMKRLARKRKYQREAKNAKTFEKEIGDSMSDIAKVIAKRNEDRLKAQDAFLDNLAAKYAKPKVKKITKNKAGSSKKTA